MILKLEIVKGMVMIEVIFEGEYCGWVGVGVGVEVELIVELMVEF